MNFIVEKSIIVEYNRSTFHVEILFRLIRESGRAEQSQGTDVGRL